LGRSAVTWRVVVKLETQFGEWQMFHYPTLVQAGCKVHIIYSDHSRGIRIATLDLNFVS
jgi:hypothetical protein